MTIESGIALAVGLVGLVSSIVTPVFVVGRFLGNVLTTQAQHARDHERHDRSAQSTGLRLEALGKEIAELRGEVRGRGAGEFSGRVG